MTATSIHFRVGNGDMTLFELDGGKTLLVDTNITAAADDPNDETPDVAKQLRDRLKRDAQGRLFVDAFLLTHPDHDHCRGLRAHFHLGPLNEWCEADDKIVIREMWSSPIVFRRASRKHVLGDDAKAWACEARRRVKRFRERGYLLEGDWIKILGEDVNGKTDGLGTILVRCNEEFASIAGEQGSFRARLLAPMAPAGDELEEQLSKNNSSVILGLSLTVDFQNDAARYLIGGDAEVLIWERVWDRNKHQPANLAYDILLAPHHCSWHSLSWYSWSVWGEGAVVSEDARKALAQARDGAQILSSSKPIQDDKDDPPCIRAKREYQAILAPVQGKFHCIADGTSDAPYEIEVTHAGHRPKRARAAATVATMTGIGTVPLSHG
ncbi:MBL fold metallo-hydrolase [Xanthobacter wiegelii]|uniref:MBL fold metallo-hydrolase n=1 Tax=Xanthobacter wiegelii TaxID=3119913 RepID=UPI003727707A